MKDSEKIDSIKTWLDSGSVNLFGRPFSGKDTQGRVLADLFGGVLLGGGEILRGGTMPEHIKQHMRTGKLIPTADYITIVLPYLSQENFQGNPLILSSVGRWRGEEPGVIEAAEASGHPLKAAVYLALNENVVRKRWHALNDTNDRGDRHDDTEEILEIRLQEFREKTLPVIEYYRERGLLIEIDGSQSVDTVTKALLTALASRASTSP